MLNLSMLHEYTIKNNIVLFLNGPLSNWYGAFKNQENGQFEMELEKGKHPFKFNCSEQAMMYAKAWLFEDHEACNKILLERHPREQKALGRAVKNYNEDRWAKARANIVFNILLSKFRQNSDLRKFLCEDLDLYILAEAADYDKVWGIGLDEYDERAWDVKTWQGQNLLGRCLMRTREALKQI
jgi:ribA/ribD-fused uncharacterized protein